MRAVAHGWKKPGGGGPSKAVAKDFVVADKSKGKAKPNNPNPNHGENDLPVFKAKKFSRGGAVRGVGAAVKGGGRAC